MTGAAGAASDGALPPVLLLGFGRMGSALAAGWLERGIDRVVAIDPALPCAPAGVQVVDGVDSVPAGFAPAALVLAVKPQMAAAALPACADLARNAVAVSIMAGWPIQRIGAALGAHGAVVRAMPNTPAAIRKGVTVACAGPGVDAARRGLAEALLRAVGDVAWVEDEALLDPVTAVSGGGPAYVFLLAELLEQAAVAQGIPADLARLMARGTVSGAGALLAASGEDAAALRRAVTSPAGTTERALAVLMADAAWPALVSRAVAAATERSRELAG